MSLSKIDPEKKKKNKQTNIQTNNKQQTVN